MFTASYHELPYNHIWSVNNLRCSPIRGINHHVTIYGVPVNFVVYSSAEWTTVRPYMWPDLQEGILYPHHFRTQISPSFYGYIIMFACFVVNSSPVCFSWGCFLSHVRRPWMLGLYSVVSAGSSTKATRLWGLTRPCSDIIYWFSYFLGQFKHKWIHKTNVTVQRVFSPPLHGSRPPPTNHPYICNEWLVALVKNHLKWWEIQLANASHQREH